MYRVLAVCTGNICRSPAMELLLASQLDATVEVGGAGTYGLDAWPISEPMGRLLAADGIASDHFSSTPLTAELAVSADLIIAATAEHRRLVLQQTPSALNKTVVLGELARLTSGLPSSALARIASLGDDASRLAALVKEALASRHHWVGSVARTDDDVPDPYKKGDEAYAASYAQIKQCVETIVAALGPRPEVSGADAARGERAGTPDRGRGEHQGAERRTGSTSSGTGTDSGRRDEVEPGDISRLLGSEAPCIPDAPKAPSEPVEPHSAPVVVHRFGPKDGPPIVLLHGVTDSGMDWPDAVDRWSGICQILAVDLRGHGSSPRFTQAERGAFNVTMVSDVLEVLHSLPTPPVVVGHSLGANLALQAAIVDPSAVLALVLEDPPLPIVGSRRDQAAFGEQLAEWVSTFHSDAGKAAHIAKARATTTWPRAEIDAWAASKRSVDRGMLTALGLIGIDWAPALAVSKIPTLILLPTDEPLGGPRLRAPELAPALASNNPALRVEWVSGVGHCIRRDDPEAYHDLVDPFIAAAFVSASDAANGATQDGDAEPGVNPDTTDL